MSGTSADGIDAVTARLSGHATALCADILSHIHIAFPRSLRSRILSACVSGTVAEICELNFYLGERFADAALKVISKAGLTRPHIALIASHGQTVHHLPRARHPSTLQIGEPCVIAERTGITTVGDFRVRDIAAGGQGAPLVAYADWALFRHPSLHTVVQNIGGIANLTHLPPNCSQCNVRAFDTGPGNMLIDALVAQCSKGRLSFDRDGKIAGKRRVSQPLLNWCMHHPFLRRKPPKTTGREEFGPAFLESFLAEARRGRINDEDMVSTATAFTSASIADACRKFVLPADSRSAVLPFKNFRFILGGGGAANLTLVAMLRRELPGAQLFTHADFNIPDAAKEALAFAILGYETLAGVPSNVPSATGARHPVLLGKIAPGQGYRSVL